VKHWHNLNNNVGESDVDYDGGNIFQCLMCIQTLAQNLSDKGA
jgi:hypothetical protein